MRPFKTIGKRHIGVNHNSGFGTTLFTLLIKLIGLNHTFDLGAICVGGNMIRPPSFIRQKAQKVFPLLCFLGASNGRALAQRRVNPIFLFLSGSRKNATRATSGEAAVANSQC